jgi:hypothetical protein
MAPICLFWCLRRERNNSSFEDLESTLEDILSLFYHSLYFWTTIYVHHLSFSFPDFLARFFLSNLVFSWYTPSVIMGALWVEGGTRYSIISREM